MFNKNTYPSEDIKQYITSIILLYYKSSNNWHDTVEAILACSAKLEANTYSRALIYIITNDLSSVHFSDLFEGNRLSKALKAITYSNTMTYSKTHPRIISSP